jgi:trimeric autotransporter adhesin
MKKKAIKIAAASAVAASAFVAAAPLQSNAASNVVTTVDQAVMQMQKAYHTYGDVTATGNFADINAVYKQYNVAKAAYANAKAIVIKAGGTQKDVYLAKLDSNYKTYLTDCVVPYIDAYNYAVQNLQANQEALQTAIDAKNMADVQKYYNEISYQLKVRTVILDRVYGQSTRELLRSSFKADAQALRDAMQFDVTVAAKVNAVNDAIAAGKLDVAKAAVDQINKFLPQVTSTFKADLTAKATAAIAAYEATKTPMVEKVSAINTKTIVVKFNTELTSDATVANDASETVLYSLDGVNPTSAVLSEDKKSVTLTFAGDVEGNDQVVVVNPIATPKKDADGNVVKTEKYSQVFSYTDEIKPEVVGTSYANGKITLEFSEPVGQLPTVVRVNGTPVTAIAQGDATNKVDVTYNLADSATATLYVAGAKDASVAANEMALYNGTVIAPSADKAKPQVVGVQVTGQNTAKVTLSEAITSPTVAATLQTGATQTPVTLTKDVTDTTGKTYTLTVAGLFTSGTSTSESFTLYVAAGAMTDTATPGNTNDLFSTSVTFNKDVTAPAFVSSQVSSDNKKLEFKFDENLTVAGSTANIVIKNTDGVKIPVVDAETALKTDDVKTYQVDTKVTDVVLDAGTYTVSIPAGFFTDAYGNKSAAVTSTFTVGAPTTSADTTKPTAAVTNAGTNVFEVAYNEEVSSSALNLANYKLDGKSLPVGTEIYFTSTAKTTVDIVLPANSINIGNQITGASAVLTVSGVADKAGNVINTANSDVVVKDNTAATVTNVQVLGTDVYVTFNEDVTVPATTNALDAFAVTVNGNALTAADVSDLVAVSGNTKQVKFSLVNAPAATPVVTVKAAQLVLTDANGALVK